MTERSPASLRLPALDRRLSAVAEAIPLCRRAADIGADHGRLSLHLLAQGRCRHMIVSDISEYSLKKARHLLAIHGMDSRASFICADGLDAVNRPVEAIIISGLGGKTIADMLKRQPIPYDAQLILSPQTALPAVRKVLGGISYRLLREQVVKEADRYYHVMCAVPGLTTCSEKALYIGPVLVADTWQLLSEYFQWRIRVVAQARTTMARQQEEWLKEGLRNVQRDRKNHLYTD